MLPSSRAWVTFGLLSFALADCVVNPPRSAPQQQAGAYTVPPSYPPPAPPPPPVQRPWYAAFQLPALPPPPPLSSFQIPGLPSIPFPQIPGLTPPATPQPAQPAQPGTVGAARCGMVNIGGSPVAIDCMTPNYGLVPLASQYVMNRAAFSAGRGYDGAAPQPAAVDHRSDGTEGPIRSQGPVGACTGFSLAAAIDHAIATSKGKAGAVSIMELWGRYHYPQMQNAIDANKGQPLGVESAWPYDRKQACAWYTGGDCDCGLNLGVSCNQPVNAAQLAKVDATSIATLGNVTRLPDGNLDEIKAVLAKGQDVWFAMYVDDRLSQVQGANAVVPDGDFRASREGHAMVLAGYKTQSNGTYYLLHNSWGTNWGDNGYAWIFENTLRTNLKYAYVVDVSTPSAPAPSQPSSQPANPNAPGQPTPPLANAGYCPAGTVPDSGMLVCLPPCPDGSPRHFNTCAASAPGAPSGCPQGQVNIFGFCVTSPMPGFATDSATGIRHQCGAGGCTYTVPGGVAGCRAAVCMRSCPSPKFLLTAGPLGLGCSE